MPWWYLPFHQVPSEYKAVMHFFLAAGITNVNISFPFLGAEVLHLVRLRRRRFRLGGFPMSGTNPECVTVSRSAAEKEVALIGCRTLRS